MSLQSICLRLSAKRSDAKRDAGLTTPSDIIRFDNIRYGKYGKWNLLDVYRPADAAGKLPVIISVHGGGWVYGDKDLYQHYCMSLAQRGFAVVNFSYRLAPRYRYPAQMNDINKVIRWTLKHGKEYGIDTRHVFLVGDSAGAHLAALYCCLCSNPAYAAKYHLKPPKDFLPTAVALNCGVYTMAKSLPSNRGMESGLLKDLLGPGYTEYEIGRITPWKYITSDFPPVFVMTGTGDFLKEQAPYLTRRLEKHHVPFQYKIYGTEENLLPHVFHCDMYSPDARQCNDDECAFFRSFLS